jgi:beta-lactam-binding protein with PASTA domain
MAGVDPGAETVVEEEVVPPGPPRPRPPLIWPWLLVLLVLVAGGLIALWLFTRGGGDHNKPPVVTVPNVVRQKQGKAVSRLRQAGLVPRIVTKPSGFPAGTVFKEDPPAHSRVEKDSAVTLSVSASAIVTVPDVTRMKAAAATAALRKRGLATQTVSVVSKERTGNVVSQSPSAGARVGKGSVVALRVSRGRLRVPNVVGQDRSSAVAAIRAAKLQPTVVTVSSGQPKGTVVAQAPSAGTQVAAGSKVRLNVSNGTGSGGAPPPPPPQPPPPPARATVPIVTGMSQAQAQRKLAAVGFKAGVVYVPFDSPEETVVAQSPDGGTTARRGTRIQLNAALGSNPGALETVPSVLGLSAAQARSRLSGAGFKVQQLTRKVTRASQAGTIVDEQPAKKAPAGTTVTIYAGTT